MALIPGASGTTTKAVDGIEGATSGAPVSFPSGFQGAAIPSTLADSNITLTNTSNPVMVMTPTANRTITLPSTGIPANYSITVINRSASFTIAVNASGGGTVVTVGLGQVTVLSTQASPTTTAHWSISTNGAILQGGNSLGTSVLIGTNDNFGIDFETNGSIKASISAAGAMTVGAQVSSNFNGPVHQIAGYLAVRTPTTPDSDQTGNIELSTNCFRGALGNRWSSVLGGSSLALKTRSASSSTAFEFKANQPGESLSANAIDIGTATHAGAWTLGASGTGVGHLIQGSGADTHVLRIRNNLNSLRADALTLSTANANVTQGTRGSTALLRGFNDPAGETRNSTEVVVIRADGNVYNNNTVYGATSDRSLKQNIRDARNYLADLCQLRVVKYERIDSPELTQLGLIAQEVETVFPGLVEGEEGAKSVKYSIINIMMLKAIQELHQELQAAKAEIEALKNA